METVFPRGRTGHALPVRERRERPDALLVLDAEHCVAACVRDHEAAVALEDVEGAEC
jgi:hypothetical protein